MIFISRMINQFFLFIEKVKGSTTVVEVKTPKNLVGHLTGYSIHGYEMQIFCQKRHYRRSYDKWFIPNENHVAYRVFSIVTNDAPSRLKKACELDIVIPELMGDTISERRRQQAVIDAYLDILAQSLIDSQPRLTNSNGVESDDDGTPKKELIDIFNRQRKSDS